VGGGLPIAVGLALADKMRNLPQITCCFFGEGAAAEGEFHEALNLAALWHLPVLFVCENNLYAMGTAIWRSQSMTDVALKASAYAMPTESVDGMDVLAVRDAAVRAVAAMKKNHGPYFLECRTYRFRAHSMFDPELYRSKAEVDLWKQYDPIQMLASRLKEISPDAGADLDSIEKTVAAEIADAVAFADSGTLEPIDELTNFVYSKVRAA
jgi:TPP-dependent pyruvate/acetoin dehydrogenase alpha subunit